MYRTINHTISCETYRLSDKAARNYTKCSYKSGGQGGEKNKRYSEKKIDGLSAGQSYDGIPFCKEKRNPTKYDMEYLEKGRL